MPDAQRTQAIDSVYGVISLDMGDLLRSVPCVTVRVAEVGGTWKRRSPKRQSLLREERPPTYVILSRNLVLSRFTRFLEGFRRAFNESHPAIVGVS